MCGIAGIMTPDGRPPAADLLDRLQRALAHRGPDGAGRLIDGATALLHTRLSIIDLDGGAQPIFGPNGSAIVANGEIYNYLELREDLSGVAWTTHSDCEPPLHLYDRHGLSFCDHLRGMYALAILDPVRRRLILSRDPFGIKPLYYVEAAQGFAFASEPQALIAAGLAAPNLHADARDALLQTQFTTGTETIFSGIRRVMPGETIAVEGGKIVERHHRPALPAHAPRPMDLRSALEDLDTVLTESVTLHQRSDVPYGMFLSGGVDSSVLLALMKRLNPTPVVAFTAGFPGTAARDERDHARALAARTGAEHIEVAFTEDDFWTLLPRVAEAMDDPAADYATLPTFKLALEARKSVKVVLSGEGGDEMFAGYGRYRAADRPWPFAKAMRRKGAFDILPDVLRHPPVHWRDGIIASERRAAAVKDWTRLQGLQAVDCADWLPNDLLTKLDRCLMAVGVEGRVPFLDPVVADFAFRLPDALKIRRKSGKWLLRRWLDDVLPEAQAFSAKRGFTVPVGEWIGATDGRLGPLVAAQPGIREICHPDAVEKLFANVGKRTGFAAWTLLFYALWHHRHVLGVRPQGDAFETLSAQP